MHHVRCEATRYRCSAHNCPLFQDQGTRLTKFSTRHVVECDIRVQHGAARRRLNLLSKRSSSGGVVTFRPWRSADKTD